MVTYKGTPRIFATLINSSRICPASRKRTFRSSDIALFTNKASGSGVSGKMTSIGLIGVLRIISIGL